MASPSANCPRTARPDPDLSSMGGACPVWFDGLGGCLDCNRGLCTICDLVGTERQTRRKTITWSLNLVRLSARVFGGGSIPFIAYRLAPIMMFEFPHENGRWRIDYGSGNSEDATRPVLSYGPGSGVAAYLGQPVRIRQPYPNDRRDRLQSEG